MSRPTTYWDNIKVSSINEDDDQLVDDQPDIPVIIYSLSLDLHH